MRGAEGRAFDITVAPARLCFQAEIISDTKALTVVNLADKGDKEKGPRVSVVDWVSRTSLDIPER